MNGGCRTSCKSRASRLRRGRVFSRAAGGVGVAASSTRVIVPRLGIGDEARGVSGRAPLFERVPPRSRQGVREPPSSFLRLHPREAGDARGASRGPRGDALSLRDPRIPLSRRPLRLVHARGRQTRASVVGFPPRPSRVARRDGPPLRHERGRGERYGERRRDRRRRGDAGRRRARAPPHLCVRVLRRRGAPRPRRAHRRARVRQQRGARRSSLFPHRRPVPGCPVPRGGPRAPGRHTHELSHHLRRAVSAANRRPRPRRRRVPGDALRRGQRRRRGDCRASHRRRPRRRRRFRSTPRSRGRATRGAPLALPGTHSACPLGHRRDAV